MYRLVDAFDADVLIYAVVADHLLGRRVGARSLSIELPLPERSPGSGSVLLIPELLTKPLR